MSEIDIYKHIGQQMISDREKIKELEAEIQELNDSITWWTNRYNAVVKMNDDNVKTINKAIAYIEYYCIGNLQYENKTHKVLLTILRGDK